MTQLFKAVDRRDGVLKRWIVNDNGVARAAWFYDMDEGEQIRTTQDNEATYSYASSKALDDAINPVLVAEW